MSKEVVLNRIQSQFLQSEQEFKVLIGGVGLGKSTLIGFVNFMKFKEMPKAKNLLVGLTYNQIFNITLPQMVYAWTLCGLKEAEIGEFGHYVIGKKPPSYFTKAHHPPKKYNNVITFINGYTIQLASADRPELLRGLSVDSLDIDEISLFKREVVTRNILTRIRGQKGLYDSHWYLSKSFYGNMPYLLSGVWVLDYEQLNKENPNRVFFLDAPTVENVDIVGQNYLDTLKMSLTSLEYAVEVENSRAHLTKLPNSFYPDFDEDKHTYQERYSYKEDNDTTIISSLSDYSSDLPMMLTLDFNAAFNSALLAQQPNKLEIRFIDEFYDATYKTSAEVVRQFIDRYANHKNKVVYIYGDRNGNNTSAQKGKVTIYSEIEEQLKQAGWKVILTDKIKYNRKDSELKDRHFAISKLLSEKDSTLPIIRINATKCKWAIVSIRNTPIEQDFKKDKSSERMKIDQRQATHLSDCFDNLVFEFAKAKKTYRPSIPSVR
jgi:hypothetical protein